MKKRNFCVIKVLFFDKDTDIERQLLSSKFSTGEKKYYTVIVVYCKYFIGYLYHDHEVKPLHTMLQKTSVYVNIFEEQANK